MAMSKTSRLVVVSNRLPVILCQNGEGWTASQGGGGLVQALDPVLRAQGGVWLGWPGVSDETGWEEALAAAGQERGYDFVAVPLDEALVRDFYGGFSNAILWPLFHNLDDRCNFEPAYYSAFDEANRRFATIIANHVRRSDFVWIQDYQLIRVATHLRELGVQSDVGFFLHIPFPSLESFVKLPWRAQILRALLDYDQVGFQTERDRRNFLDCVERLLPEASIRTDQRECALSEVVVEGRVTRVGSFPIGIDAASVAEQAASDAVGRRTLQLRVDLGDAAVLLGVDRLDYTKGIPERFLAFEHLLEQAPELCERVVLFQIVQPSRELVAEYQELKREIDRLVGAINGRFGTPGWVPIHYVYRGLDHTDLFAMYRLARVALVTPLKDGMNLVAKEYCACQIDEPGSLVLSEFAGAAAQLHEHAFIVNPYDVEGTARAIREALTMGLDERRRRMDAMRDGIAKEDVFWWTRRFLDATDGGSVESVEEYVPDLDRESIPSRSISARPR
jgi:alpha,alpha-trehalose-phosphate synthase [UDP-forming]